MLVLSKKMCFLQSDNHPSWSRQCPTFLKKLTDLNSRNLDNSTLFFPSSDPWTWATKSNTDTAPTHTAFPQSQQSQTALNPRPRLNPSDRHQNNNNNRHPPSPRHNNTYFPNYSSLHNPVDNNLINSWSAQYDLGTLTTSSQPRPGTNDVQNNRAIVAAMLSPPEILDTLNDV